VVLLSLRHYALLLPSLWIPTELSLVFILQKYIDKENKMCSFFVIVPTHRTKEIPLRDKQYWRKQHHILFNSFPIPNSVHVSEPNNNGNKMKMHTHIHTKGTK